MWLRRLRSFLALPAFERGLALRALGWLFVLTLATRRLSFPRVRQLVERRPPGPRRSDEWPRAVRRAMKRAERSLPGSTCLTRALTAELLLRRGGHPARLSIGVASGAAGIPLDAHAWVESGSLVVTGDAALPSYAPILVLGAPS